MIRIPLIVVTLFLAVTVCLWTRPTRVLASGQRVTRVYVAASGIDQNPCTFALPCRGVNRARATFDGTTRSGTITIIESGNYPAFEIQDLGPTIHRSVTVEAAPGVTATITGGVQDAGIYIHVGSQDRVVLRNLHLDQGSGNNGIDVKTGRWTYVESCFIENVNHAIDIRNSSELFVTDSIFRQDTIGVFAEGASVSIDNCRFEQDSAIGVNVADGAHVVIRNSVIAGTSDDGVVCSSNRPNVRTRLFVENTSITGSGFKCVGICTNHAGVKAGEGQYPVEVTLSNDVITQNQVGVIVANNATVFSFGDNRINGNGNGAGDGTGANDVQGALSLIKPH